MKYRNKLVLLGRHSFSPSCLFILRNQITFEWDSPCSVANYHDACVSLTPHKLSGDRVPLPHHQQLHHPDLTCVWRGLASHLHTCQVNILIKPVDIIMIIKHSMPEVAYNIQRHQPTFPLIYTQLACMDE